VRSIPLRYHEADAGPTAWLLNYLKNLNQLPCDEHQKRGLTGFVCSKMNGTCERRERKELMKCNCGAELQFEKICKKLSRHKVSEHALAR
jgi:hypothetical protein